MTSEQLRRICAVRPFVPFAIHAADGRQWIVRHPDTVVLSSAGRTVVVQNAEGMDEILDVLLIMSLRPLAERHNSRGTENAS